MKSRNQSPNQSKNVRSDMGKNILNSKDDPKIEKAKAELKILKKFINNRMSDFGNDDKRIQ